MNYVIIKKSAFFDYISTHLMFETKEDATKIANELNSIKETSDFSVLRL